jgi:hypothetical protein
VYADYSQQEFYISAVLSEDAQMMADYRSGDVYMELAKQLYRLPAHVTKDTDEDCATKRATVKTMTLGTQYCMGAEGLAIRAGEPINLLGRRFLTEFESRYRVFDGWKEAASDDFVQKGHAETVLGWRLYNGGTGVFDEDTRRHRKPNARSITNFPIQGTGADILRVACWLLYDAGLTITAPVHDAVMLMLPTDDTFLFKLNYALYLMMAASEAVLGEGHALKVEAAVYPHGTYYTDKEGAKIWGAVKQIPAIARLPQCSTQGSGGGFEYKPAITDVMRLFR